MDFALSQSPRAPLSSSYNQTVVLLRITRFTLLVRVTEW